MKLRLMWGRAQKTRGPEGVGGVPQPVGAMGGTTALAMRIALLGSAETGMVLVPGGTACASYLCCFHFLHKKVLYVQYYIFHVCRLHQ